VAYQQTTLEGAAHSLLNWPTADVQTDVVLVLLKFSDHPLQLAYQMGCQLSCHHLELKQAVLGYIFTNSKNYPDHE